MTYKAPDEKAAAGLPFVIKSGTLNADKAEGTVEVDPKEGRIKSSTMDLKLSGKLNIDIGGMVTEVNLEQTQTSTLKTYDTNPLEKEKK
jgi:hypothetical protein